MFSTFITFLVLSTFASATPAQDPPVSGYNLKQPNTTQNLPKVLREVSGLTDINASTFACVQDEKGVLFIYDMLQNNIVDKHMFHADGDYEGITYANGLMYVLRSDGKLFEIANYNNDKRRITTYNTNIPAIDNEGLCYDAQQNRLLIACKSKAGKGPKFKDKRHIYAFNLATKKLEDKPAFIIDVNDAKAFAQLHNLPIPRKKGKKKNKKDGKPIIKIKTSAIAVHPINGNLYLLSAADYLFFVFSPQGKILHMEPLNPTTFNKAEGITFMPNGDMCITNEGEDHKPTLLTFKYLN